MMTTYIKPNKFTLVLGVFVLTSFSFCIYASEAEGEGLDHRWGVGVFLGATHIHGENEATLFPPVAQG